MSFTRKFAIEAPYGPDPKPCPSPLRKQGSRKKRPFGDFGRKQLSSLIAPDFHFASCALGNMNVSVKPGIHFYRPDKKVRKMPPFIDSLSTNLKRGP